MGKVYINNVLIPESTYSAEYFSNIPINFKAVPATGYKFSHWEGLPEVYNREQNITTGSNISVKAVFEPSGENILLSVFDKDTVLTKVFSPYVGTKDIVVEHGVTLQINEGVEIRMPEQASFYVYVSSSACRG